MAQKLDINTYTFQSGNKVIDIDPERFEYFINGFQGNLEAIRDYASMDEYQDLEDSFKELESQYEEWSNGNHSNDLKNNILESFMHFDDYSRFLAANHWDKENQTFEVFNTNYHNYDEWREESVENEIPLTEKPYTENQEAVKEEISFEDYIHSDEFIEKFGDWEKANRLEKLKESESLIGNSTILLDGVDISDEVKKLQSSYSKENLKQLQNIARDVGREIIEKLRKEQNINNPNPPVLINKDSGTEFRIQMTGINEIKNHNIFSKGHIEAISSIPDIIQNCIYISTEPNEDEKKPENLKYHYFATGIKLDNEDFTAKIVFTERKDGKLFYDQSLSEIEKGRLIDIIREKNMPGAFNQINHSDSTEQSEVLNPLISQENLDNYDKRLVSICQVPQMQYLEKNPLTNKWQPTKEAIELVKNGFLHIEKKGQEYSMVNSKKINIENENNQLEQTSLDNAADLLKTMKFNKDNYKELLDVINKISALNGKEQLQVPTEEQVQNIVSAEETSQPEKEGVGEKATEEVPVTTKPFDPKAPVDFGKTVLPAFAVLSEGKLHTVENGVVASFDKMKETYLIDNGTERFELPKSTFETLLKDKVEEEQKKVRLAEGKTIVFEDKSRGVQGTVIPEWAMYTQNGLETFKDFVAQKYNAADNSYTLSNGQTTINVDAERFKEITAPERFETKYDENSPAYKKLCETQYNDYFKPRDNTAYNFRHNLSVFCRKEANSPCDAFTIAKGIIKEMNHKEKKKTKELIKKMCGKNETINEVIVRCYHEAIKEIPLNEDYIKSVIPEKIIARPFYDTINTDGTKIENDPVLIQGNINKNLSIGSTIKNINIDTKKLFGHGKKAVHFDELKVISASKENNSITVMDENKSYMKLPRDTVLEFYKQQQIKELKQIQKQNKKNNSIHISSY